MTTRQAEALAGVSRSTMHRAAVAEAAGGTGTKYPVDRSEPANKLSAAERDQVLAVLHSDRFIDQAPQQIYATLLSEGTYVCSVSTMYRLLHDSAQVTERRRQARHPARKVPELVATEPGEVFTWDITKLAGPTKGIYYNAYVMLDIFSRFIVGCVVHTRESAGLAEDFMATVFGVYGIPKVVQGLSEYLCKFPCQSLSMVHSCCLDQVWFYPLGEGQRQVLQGLVPATGASTFHQSATGCGSGRFALLGFFGLVFGPLWCAFIFDIANGQPQQFHRGFIVGEMAPVLGDFA